MILLPRQARDKTYGQTLLTQKLTTQPRVFEQEMWPESSREVFWKQAEEMTGVTLDVAAAATPPPRRRNCN
jgi:hypothetical protein